MDKQDLLTRLKEIVGPEHVLHSDMDLTLYGYDASLEKGKPDVVVLPNSAEEVSRVVASAYEGKIPIIGRGSGTNLSGGTIPVRGGIVIHFSRMNRVLEVDLPNRTVTVEPGVITLNLRICS
jgi:glycolate oxidase